MPFSPWPPPDVPDVDLASFALRHAVRLADRPALIDGDRVVTYAELAERRAAGDGRPQRRGAAAPERR
jgi:non-ribosomal peptide synthetase component E (peptide arylation enzyme)